MARYISRVVTMAVLTALFLSVQAVGAALPAQFEQPVHDGLAWLVAQQKPVGSWGESPGQCSNDLRVEKTAFAVLKMLDRARELHESPPPAVQNGLDFIFSKVQPDGSIWDYYDYKNPDCYESIPPIVPETSAAILAITSADTPDATAPNGQTYKEIVQGAVDYLVWAQRGTDYPDDAGGWTFARDDSNFDISSLPADQVNTGHAALALVYAEKKSGIIIDTSVKDKLGIWVTNIQDDSGGATLVTGGEYPDIQYTGALLVEQFLLGRNPSQDLDVQDAISYIDTNWAGWDGGGSLEKYTLTSGLVLMDVDTLTADNVDWFDVLTSHVLQAQVPDGPGMVYWPPESYRDSILPTAWALLTLEGKVGGIVTDNPQPVLIDIKPGSCPNAFNLGEKGVLPVAVVGTVDLDVTQIDPETVKLNGVPVLKKRWAYEDVATPYPGTTLCGCHEMTGDGTRDLTLKFNHQDVAATLSSGIPLKDEPVPLALTGNLKAEFGGTPFEGSDCIWVVM